MNRTTGILIICTLLCWNCFPAKSQLSFHIDSLSFSTFKVDTRIKTWEDKALYSFGPDIIVYGRLVNTGSQPIITKLTSLQTVPKDSLIFHTDLHLFMSYRNGKDYYFEPYPLITSDFMTYPYYEGMCPPKKTIDIDGISRFYSIIKAGESIPLAFESLSCPIDGEFKIEGLKSIIPINKRRTVKTQRKAVEAIKSTLVIIPFVETYEDSSGIYNRILDYESQLNQTATEYDFDTSLPQFFLDRKASFISGGKEGFQQWFVEQIKKSQNWPNVAKQRYFVSFVVGKDGDVVFSKVFGGHNMEINDYLGKIIWGILQQSPKWQPGVLNGQIVDSRIMLMVTINTKEEITCITLP